MISCSAKVSVIPSLVKMASDKRLNFRNSYGPVTSTQNPVSFKLSDGDFQPVSKTFGVCVVHELEIALDLFRCRIAL